MFDLAIDRHEPLDGDALALRTMRVRHDRALVGELERENVSIRALFDRMVRARDAGDEPMRVATLQVFSACLRAHLSKESRFLYPLLETSCASGRAELGALLAEMHGIGRSLRMVTRDAQALGCLHGEPLEIAALLDRRATVGEAVLYPLYEAARSGQAAA